MSEERKTLCLGHVPNPIAEGGGCGSPDSEIFFTAPINLLAGDQVLIDPASGQPLAVYREGRLFWKFEGYYVTGSVTFTGKFDNGVVAKFFQGMR